MNDTIYHDLELKVFGKKYITYNLNRLTTSEKSGFAELIDEYGLWGEYANGNMIFKKNIISSICRNNLRLVLLKVLDSNNIKKKFVDIIDNVRHDKDYLNAILLVLIGNILNIDLSIDTLIYLLDQKFIDNPAFINNPNIREIINFGEYKINVRSSILSEALISEFKDGRAIVDLLVNISKKIDRGVTSYKYSEQRFTLRRIISHTRLQALLAQTNENSDELISHYFEKIKNINYCKRNPHFWLQYAITRLSLKDYRNAKIYFDNAYSFGSQIPQYDTTAVDNHYARYLIENEIHENNIDTAMKNFLVAHDILTDYNNNSLKQYPYRVAINYRAFYDKFYKRLDNKSQNKFIECCKDILDRINSYRSEIGSSYALHSDIIKCEQNLTYIFKREKINY